ncbi:MAG: CRISPR-associated endonuclease Cas2 [Fimbriimonadaceae bacterium]|nr:CRISPR-associated endonuclease Cas2 [Fimbriimonadaceae bacterium]
MWVVAFFDLPTETRKHKTAYRKFREFLLKDGYIMLQYSVYARPCADRESADKHERRIETQVPEEGEVRLLSLTALQYSRMRCFFGETESDPEKLPSQLSFF